MSEPLFDSNNTETDKGIFIFKKYLRLEKGISLGNFIMSQTHILLYVLIFFVMEIMKVRLLRVSDYFNFTEEEESKLLSYLFMEETTIKFLTFPIFGYLNDKIGRKKVCMSGYIIQIFILYGITIARNIYVLFILWGIYTVGIVCLVAPPLTGDYIENEYKGKGIGFQYLITTFGGLLASIYQLVLVKYNQYYSIYGLIIMSFFTAIAGHFYLKSGLYHKDQQSSDISKDQESKLLDEQIDTEQKQKQETNLIKMLKNQPWLIVAFIISFVTGCQPNLASTFIVLWAKSFYPQSQQNVADASATRLTTTTYAAVFLFALLIGAALDKLKTIKIFTWIHILMILGATLIILVNDIFNILIFGCFFILGIGIAGQMILVNFLKFKYTTNQQRGVINGFTQMIASLGGLVINFSGSWIFPYFNAIPFLLYGTFALITYVVSLMIYFKAIRTK